MMRAGRSFAVGVAFAALAAGVGRAELVRVETVGSVPLAAGSTGGATARQAALEAGVREAVERAALDLASQAGAGAPAEAVRAALGNDLLLYASRFRILEDRGERAPLLEQSPAAQREYVVTVEAHVDRSRLRSRLRQAGLLGAEPQPGARRAVRIAFEGVDSYRLWERIERALGARGGAVRPLEFAHRRVVAEVETEEEAGILVRRLGVALGETIEVQSAGMDGETLLIVVAARIPSEAEAGPAAPPSEPTKQPSAR
jgi:hypothetical protein